MRIFFTLTVLFCSLNLGLFAQNSQQEKLKIYVDGWVVDFNYIRNTTPFVDFVNDSKACDVHIIVTQQNTGGGGERFTLEYLAPSMPQIGTMKLTCNTMSFDTQDIIREKLAKTLQTGLLPYINEKGGAGLVSIEAKVPVAGEDNIKVMSKDQDPWRQWVFSVNAEGGLDGEEQRKNNNVGLTFNANKVTDVWKFRARYDYERRASRIKRSNNEITHTLRVEQDADIEWVYSLSPRWSTGVFLNGSESSYNNIDKAFRAQPAIQYNFFPWKESDRRRFTFTYNVGPKYNKYVETTILGKNQQWLWEETLSLNYERKEKWGEVYSWLEGGHFFPDFENYYYQAGVDFYIRIAKGLSLSFNVQAQSIHNQVYLPAGEISDDDILLNNRRLPTSFEYSGRIGLRFQFGSIFNNIVNERL